MYTKDTNEGSVSQHSNRNSEQNGTAHEDVVTARTADDEILCSRKSRGHLSVCNFSYLRFHDHTVSIARDTSQQFLGTIRKKICNVVA